MSEDFRRGIQLFRRSDGQHSPPVETPREPYPPMAVEAGQYYIHEITTPLDGYGHVTGYKVKAAGKTSDGQGVMGEMHLQNLLRIEY